MSAETVPCFYDVIRGVHQCRLDGFNWEWPYALHFRGASMSPNVTPEWVRAHATKGEPLL